MTIAAKKEIEKITLQSWWGDKRLECWDYGQGFCIDIQCNFPSQPKDFMYGFLHITIELSYPQAKDLLSFLQACLQKREADDA